MPESRWSAVHADVEALASALEKHLDTETALMVADWIVGSPEEAEDAAFEHYYGPHGGDRSVELSFDALRRVNVARCRRWHPGFSSGADAWSGADWSNAMCGEAGEAANVVKKLRRIETDAAPGPDDPGAGQLVQMLADEIADTVIYADLLAAYYGIDLAAAVVGKFNRISARQGFPERLPAVHDGGGTDERKGVMMSSETANLCEVCGKEPAVAVAAVPGIPYSAGYCGTCLEAGQTTPYWLLVANTACVMTPGDRLEDVSAPWWIETVANTLSYLGKSREQFDRDVELALVGDPEEGR